MTLEASASRSDRPRHVQCVHGLMSSPAAMQPVVDAINRHQHRAHGTLLAGHDSDVHRIAQFRFDDFVRSVADSPFAMGDLADSIVIGTGCGGVCALTLAATSGLRAIIVVNTPSGPLTGAIADEVRRLAATGVDVADLVGYGTAPIQTLASIDAALERLALAAICCPVLAIQSRDDPTFDAETQIDRLRRGVSGPFEAVMVDRAEHVLSNTSWTLVMGRILDFIAAA